MKLHITAWVLAMLLPRLLPWSAFMGVQQAQRLSETLFELAGSRLPPRPPERQRGLWNFLTWPFVFAAIATVDSFTAKAHALIPDQDHDNLGSAHATDQPTISNGEPIAAPILPADASPTDEGDASRLVGAARWGVHIRDPQHHENSEPTLAHNTDAGSAPVAGGGGGGGGGGSNDDGNSHNSSGLSFSSGDISDISPQPISLKDVLGFDLHVNAAGSFVADDLSTALDVNPSQLVANLDSTDPSPVTQSVPLLDFVTSENLDSLLGMSKSLLDASHLNNGTLSDAALATDTSLPIVTPVLDASPVSNVPPVSIVGEATDITPGHSIDFLAPPPAPSDVLFSGNSYTDYHVTLQTAGPTVVANTVAAISTMNTADATAVAHVDAPVISHPAAPSPTDHQDPSLTHLPGALTH
jgi:hypothetical protein